MNETITIDGKDYEVLPLDRISEITHAKLAGGKVVEAEMGLYRDGTVRIDSTIPDVDPTKLDQMELEDLGIQPLKLIERTPVSFVANGNRAVFIETHTVDNHGHESPRGFWALPIPNNVDHRREFRCVEIVGEEA